MNGAEFAFDYAQLLYHKYNKRNPDHGGSYIFSWLDKKQNNNNKPH